MSLFHLFEQHARLGAVPFNQKYSGLHHAATKPIAEFSEAFKAALDNDPVLMDLARKAEPHLAMLDAHGELKEGIDVLKAGGDKAAFDKAAAAIKQLNEDAVSYLKGTKKITVDGVSHGVDEALKNAYVVAETAAKKVVGPATSRLGMVRTQEKGFVAALEANGKKMQFWKEGLKPGERGLAFAHGGAVVGAAIGLGDALLRSKNSEGEDRSTAMRVIEAVGAGVLGTAALLGGKVAMARV